MGKIIGVVVVVAVLVGVFFWWYGKSSAPALAPEKSMMGEDKPTGGVVASIKDAMGFGQKMQCTYASESDGKTIQSNVIVDGQKFKSTTVMADMTVYGLFDGVDQYTWTSKDKTGYKMSKACLDELKDSLNTAQTGGANTPKPEDLEAKLDTAQNVSCTPATGADFTLPTDVVFTDQCAMMKQSLEMMKQFKDKLPAGMPTGY